VNIPFKPQLLTIDLDGTLVDSVADLHASINAMLETVGLPGRTREEVCSWGGNGAPALVHRALTGTLEQQVGESLYKIAWDAFEHAYAELNGEASTVYSNVEQTLETLLQAQIALACVTNKPARFSEQLLTRLGLQKYFSNVISGDTLAEKKPSPAPLLHAAGVIGASPGQSIHIGDSVTDIRAARAAGFAVIGVDYGYDQGQPLTSLQGELMADAIISDFASLPGCFPLDK